jgi:hypothetical protein
MDEKITITGPKLAHAVSIRRLRTLLGDGSGTKGRFAILAVLIVPFLFQPNVPVSWQRFYGHRS